MSGEVNPWWERSGLTPPEEGGKVQEVTDPVDTTASDTGEKAQEVTEPVEAVSTESQPSMQDNAASEVGNTEQSNKTQQSGNGFEQSAKRNREEARKHREREREQLQQRIRAEEQQKTAETVKKVLADLNLKDAKGNPIETMEAYEQYQNTRRMEQMRRDLKAGQLTPEALQQALMQAPEVQGIINQAKEATKAAQKVEQDARAARYKADMEQELAEIRKFNPQIKTTDDIIRMETGPEYARLIRTGLKPSEAYRLANFDAIRANDRTAAEQAARNAAAGKAHLQSTPSAAGKALFVPPEYAANMRKYIPGISDADIAKYYKQFNSK